MPSRPSSSPLFRLDMMHLLLPLGLFSPTRSLRCCDMPLLLPDLLDSFQVAPRPQGV